MATCNFSTKHNAQYIFAFCEHGDFEKYVEDNKDIWDIETDEELEKAKFENEYLYSDWYDQEKEDRLNVLEEYLGNADETERLIDLWNDTDKFNELYWRLADKVGFQWLHEPETRALDGKKDCCYTFNADSDGKRMLFWAAIHQHTVSDLYSMAA